MIPQDSPSYYDSAMRNLLVLLIYLLYIDRCGPGVGRNCGMRAIVGPNGPKNEIDDVQGVAVNVGEYIEVRIMGPIVSQPSRPFRM
jgi:hypothetical protein